jgi:hypothetical protein
MIGKIILTNAFEQTCSYRFGFSLSLYLVYDTDSFRVSFFDLLQNGAGIVCTAIIDKNYPCVFGLAEKVKKFSDIQPLFFVMTRDYNGEG